MAKTSTFDKLKRELQDQLQKDSLKYPSVGQVIGELRSQYDFMKVSYESFYTLQKTAIGLKWKKSDYEHMIDFFK
jgi:hypothetical protein